MCLYWDPFDIQTHWHTTETAFGFVAADAWLSISVMFKSLLLLRAASATTPALYLTLQAHTQAHNTHAKKKIVSQPTKGQHYQQSLPWPIQPWCQSVSQFVVAAKWLSVYGNETSDKSKKGLWFLAFIPGIAKNQHQYQLWNKNHNNTRVVLFFFCHS